MAKKITVFLLLYQLTCFNSQAQNASTDTTVVLRSRWSGYLRSIFMATDNTATLPDYYVLGVGGKLQYELSYRNSWHLGVAFYNGNRVLGNVMKEDADGRSSRYERGLVDVVHPSRSTINLLGMAYLAYQGAHLKAKIGRMSIETPIMNPQDSRFVPTLVQGLWTEYEANRVWSFQAGLINGLAPRSAPRFYSLGKSIGRTSLGKALTGEKSAYRDNVSTQGVGIIGISFRPAMPFVLHVWEYYVKNIFTSTHTELITSIGKEQWVYQVKAQYIFQMKLGNGGNDDPIKTYFTSEVPVHVLSSSVGLGYQDFLLSLNFTRIANGGRFLYPREWGSDGIYTRLSRERDEGSADTHEYMVKLERKIKKGRWEGVRWYGAYGYYDRPDIFAAWKNKYEIPSFQQVVLFLQYPVWPALEAELLLTRKMNLQQGISDADKFNKVDMNHVTITLEYAF